MRRPWIPCVLKSIVEDCDHANELAKERSAVRANGGF
jgi:hypothetical protein